MVKEIIINGNCSQSRYVLSSELQINKYRIREISIPYVWYNLKDDLCQIEVKIGSAGNWEMYQTRFTGNYSVFNVTAILNVLTQSNVNNRPWYVYFKINTTLGRTQLQLAHSTTIDIMEVKLGDFFKKYLGFDTTQLYYIYDNNVQITYNARHIYQLNPIVMYLHLPQFLRAHGEATMLVPKNKGGSTRTKMLPINAGFQNVILFRDYTPSLLNCVSFPLHELEIFFELEGGRILTEPEIFFWVTIEFE